MISQSEITNDLDTLYFKIYSEGKEAIQNKQEKIDPVLNDIEQDKRLGLTLLINLSGTIAKRFIALMEEIRKIEPEQYFYPESDLHVTVLDLVSAHTGFARDKLMISKSMKLVENSVAGLPSFGIGFNGIITSNAAVLAKGYYNDGLQKLRDRLRKAAIEQGINLQERYQTISAHSTMIRYRIALYNREKLLATVEKYNQFNLGELNVDRLQLVIHDWYNRHQETVGQFFLE